MTTTTILLLYLWPMIIVGAAHYLDKTTKTLGDFFKYWWLIFVPYINLFFAAYSICYELFVFLNKKNILKRIKNIKIK